VTTEADKIVSRHSDPLFPTKIRPTVLSGFRAQ
jgi:hypothetical protein